MGVKCVSNLSNYRVMELTYEQKCILHSEGDIKINAVAGAGKTTTIIEYARTRPYASRILYLAFNKSVKLQANIRFREEGLWHVNVETPHSLAYRYIVTACGYRVRSGEYNTYEVAELLHLPEQREKYVKYILAGHINKFFSCYCNSDKKTFGEINYLKTLTGKQTLAFVRLYYGYIEKKAKEMWHRMDSGQLEVTHDFYLKKFQLALPLLPYDFILFDEGQDASPAMLDVFLRQTAVKIIVGDRHQQIYGWRYAVNSLDKINFPSFSLSRSFRFGQQIADLAKAVLKWKKYLGSYVDVEIHGTGVTETHQRKAILARTNLGLLAKAIEYATEKEYIRHIHFEGHIQSYAYADDGTSLYDILSLYNKQRRRIRDPLIKNMADIQELERYSVHTGEFQISMLIDVVKEYGNRIPEILRAVKAKHIEDKSKADMIFSTVHRCKGMEYDAIQLVSDFIFEDKFRKGKCASGENGMRLNEEINLLYVAITRTRNSIHIPELLLPQGQTGSEHVYIVRNANPVNGTLSFMPELPAVSEKKYCYGEIRKEYPKAYAIWTVADEDELIRMREIGISIRDLCTHFGRTRGAILSRLRKCGMK